MKYEVIARRYRPRRFDEVVGQESFAQTLRGAIVQGRLAHAYLFAGPRGVGKTSMARILAKAVNCPTAADRSGPEDGWAQPCDNCATCRAIHIGQDIDVVEMDGASHRGIEDIRNLIEGVSRPPSRGPYKMYIIDEVHMLTREAFNALLKTLEEPPAHVKFVFATTEPQKIPDTVLSRCQRFDFQPIREDAIVRRLRQICAAEGREANDALLAKIARCGKGGLRDAQTLLDQLMTFCDGSLSEADLDRITGRVGDDAIDALVDAILARQPGSVLAGVRGSVARGGDPAVLLEQVVEKLHAMLGALVASMPAASAASAAGGGPTDDVEARLDRLVGSLQVLLETATRLRASAYPEVAVEVAFLKLSRLDDPRALDRALARLDDLERFGRMPHDGPRPAEASRDDGSGSEPRKPIERRQSAVPREAAMPREPAVPREPAERKAPARAEAPLCSVRPADGGRVEAVSVAEIDADDASLAGATDEAATGYARLRSLWEQVLIELREKHPDVAPYLADAQLADRPVRGPQAGSRQDELTVTFSADFYLRQMRLPRRQQLFEELVREVTGQPWKIRLELRSLSVPASPAPATAPAAARREDAGRGLRDHPLVKKSLDLFNGRFV